MFDPLRAAALHNGAGDTDEAFWLLFLSVHFGRHPVAGWHYAASVYGRLGSAGRWNWENVSGDTRGFREWMEVNSDRIKVGRNSGGFGNHRKYESLGGLSDVSTGAVVESYVDWVGPSLRHMDRFSTAAKAANGDAAAMFDILYRSMESVHRFGRVGRFDYLSTAARLGLADLRPGQTYLLGSTGPLRGARLLLFRKSGRPASATVMEERLIGLERYLNVGFDVLEDALCNWQKSPSTFKPFRG
jgi:hypothetical protein